MKRLARRIRPIYSPIYKRYVRHHLPRKYSLLNGVVTRSSRLLDPVDHYPDHKRINIEEIRENVRPDDTVVEIGAGCGVCTVWAARAAPDGDVISYEGGEEMCQIARDAVELNATILADDLQDRISLHQNIIGEPEDVWGSESEAERRPADQLPDCDVLVSDCEGSELGIVREMEISPRTAIVEVHPHLGSETEDVIDVFRSRGYTTNVRSEREEAEVEILIAHR